jgi:hypothetical protein
VSRKTGTSDGMLSALRRAFTWHWHLLGLGSLVSLAFLSGQFEAWLPFLAAGEVAYMGLLGLHPRFQRVLRGISAAEIRANEEAAAAKARFEQLMNFLSAGDEVRFRRLHERCAELLALRHNMDAKESNASVESFRAESLDRMLWLFLKLLHQRSGLERFLQSTLREDVEKELKKAESQLQEAQQRDVAAGLPESRLTTSIAERAATIRERLENHRKASEDLELVTAEIYKTEQQITHLVEVGMTMRDSVSLTAQIDGISESLQSSERTFASGAHTSFLDEESAPPLLSARADLTQGRGMVSE